MNYTPEIKTDNLFFDDMAPDAMRREARSYYEKWKAEKNPSSPAPEETTLPRKAAEEKEVSKKDSAEVPKKEVSIPPYFLIVDGSSLLSHLFYGSLPRGDGRAGEMMKDSSGRVTNGVTLFVKKLVHIIQHQKPNYIAVCWDESREHTFRRKLYQDYKRNRKEDPELKNQIRYAMEILSAAGIKQFSYKKYEADDFIASLTENFKKEVFIRIYSKDGDLLQMLDKRVTAWKIMDKKKREEFCKDLGIAADNPYIPSNAVKITEKIMESEYKMRPDQVAFFKSIAGDKADDIPGVPGIGVKGAYAIMAHFSSLEELLALLKEENAMEKFTEKEGLTKGMFSKFTGEHTIYDLTLTGELFCELSYNLAKLKKDIPFKTTLEDMAISHFDFEKCKKAASSFEIHL